MWGADCQVTGTTVTWMSWTWLLENILIIKYHLDVKYRLQVCLFDAWCAGAVSFGDYRKFRKWTLAYSNWSLVGAFQNHSFQPHFVLPDPKEQASSNTSSYCHWTILFCSQGSFSSNIEAKMNLWHFKMCSLMLRNVTTKKSFKFFDYFMCPVPEKTRRGHQKCLELEY